MKTSDFYYHLPQELIAQTPVNPRDSSRLMVYDGGADSVAHKNFSDITDYFNKGDLLVINTTKVLPVRLMGKKALTGAAIEFLLLKRVALNKWEVMLKPAKRLKAGDRVVFSEGLQAVILERTGDTFLTELIYQGVLEEILQSLGQMPLPPYIKAGLADKERYNTVYAEVAGSAAAPTAGLHFTPRLLDRLQDKGVEIAKVVLDVGLGTFLPVKAEDISGHKMHSERYYISPQAAAAVNNAVKQGRKITAVGTTAVRVLESAATDSKTVISGEGSTDIFIYPGYNFKVVDGLITNFHLPASTLIMLVSAFIGRDKTLQLYNLAVKEGYRFFSFGDAMMLNPAKI